jgi:hypothetical protein
MLERTEVIIPALVAIMQVRSLHTESLRFPGQGQSSQGQSGPKHRPKGVSDGRQVNIPAPSCARLSDGVTQKVEPSG